MVLGGWELEADRIVDELLERPEDEDEWTSLRRGLEKTVGPYRTNPDEVLTMFRFIRETPALWGRLLEKQSDWLSTAAEALAARGGSSRPPTLGDQALVAAAIGCYNVALAHWVESGGHQDFETVLDEAFAALGAKVQPGRPRRLEQLGEHPTEQRTF